MGPKSTGNGLMLRRWAKYCLFTHPGTDRVLPGVQRLPTWFKFLSIWGSKGISQIIDMRKFTFP